MKFTTMKHIFGWLLVAALLLPSAALADGAQQSATDARPLDLVNILQGTNSDIGFSRGNTLPLLGTPWGMTNWTAQSWKGSWEHGDGWFFDPNHHTLVGFRATHQPSPWMGDWGQFVLMPQTGEIAVGIDERKSPYDPETAVFRPDYMKLDLTRYDVTGELTATERCAVLRLTFDEGETGRLIIDPAFGGHVEIDGQTIRGYTTYGAGRGAPEGFRSYFVIQLDRAPRTTGTFDGGEIARDATTITGENVGSYVEFDVAGDRTVDVVVANSFISYVQAERNLQQETEGGFDAVRERVAQQWHDNLGRMEVTGGTEEQRRTFYSCLYRAQMFPHRLHELGENGEPVHYGFYTDGKTADGVLYGDNGFWDVYRTNYPFWALVYPEQLGEILEGFTNAYRESGWYPQWPSPGHRGGMIGSHIDAIIADAVVKKIGGFDVETAYEGIRKNAFEKAPSGMGRAGFEFYEKLGYVPHRKAGYSVSASLDYAYNDWCVAQVAKHLGRTEDYELLMARSKNYRELWDPETEFFRARDEAGNFIKPFNPYDWGGGYVEGGPWQCSWAVQHDPEGLADLLGGIDEATDRLDQFFGLPPVYQHGDYGHEIHEMTEMGRQEFGQLSMGNQPSHHIPYFFVEWGQPYKTQYWTRKICQDLYSSGRNGFPGDEDNGEQGAWYVMSATGLFPFCVGDPDYTLTAPLFDKVVLHLANGNTFTVRAENNSEFNHYVHERRLDGEVFEEEKISHQRVMEGGELVVKLSHLPPANARP